MTTGTKSVLFGAHAFWFHPFAVALAWWNLYRWAPALDGGRWPAILDPRAWLVFVAHDFGYIGLPNMDGEEGERHPERAAIVVSALLDWPGLPSISELRGYWRRPLTGENTPIWAIGPWGMFALLHSRHYAKRIGLQPSRLCAADKLSLSFTPWWLYLPGVTLSGEIEEYLGEARKLGRTIGISHGSKREWYESMRAYCARWAHRHADGSADTWTGDRRGGVADTPER